MEVGQHPGVELEAAFHAHAFVTGVRAGTGHHGAGEQDDRQPDGGDGRQGTNIVREAAHGSDVIGLGDTHVQQCGDPDQHHGRQEVDRDSPPLQIKDHRNPAEDGLDDDAETGEEGQPQDLATTLRPQHNHKQSQGDQREHDRQQAVSELNELVDGRRRPGHGDQRTLVAVGPSVTTEAGTGHPDNGAGDGDSSLCNEKDHRQHALNTQ